MAGRVGGILFFVLLAMSTCVFVVQIGGRGIGV